MIFWHWYLLIIEHLRQDASFSNESNAGASSLLYTMCRWIFWSLLTNSTFGMGTTWRVYRFCYEIICIICIKHGAQKWKLVGFFVELGHMYGPNCSKFPKVWPSGPTVLHSGPLDPLFWAFGPLLYIKNSMTQTVASLPYICSNGHVQSWLTLTISTDVKIRSKRKILKLYQSNIQGGPLFGGTIWFKW